MPPPAGTEWKWRHHWLTRPGKQEVRLPGVLTTMSDSRQTEVLRSVSIGDVPTPADDFDRCYRAVQSRDPRFDGWFFTAVHTTGIYCRPSCPAITPRAANASFFPSAAAAQAAGFRACLRCRPDAAPGSPEWDVRADVVARTMRLILDGAVDRVGVRGLAAMVGYSERQLNRTLVAEVGTGALAIARAQRAQTARLLLETTDLPISTIAFAAGFASVRQFNDTVQSIFARTPTFLRVRRVRKGRAGEAAEPGGGITLRLAYRTPFNGTAIMGFLGQRAVPGLEAISTTTTANRTTSTTSTTSKASTAATASTASTAASAAAGDPGLSRSLHLDHGDGVVELQPDDGLSARASIWRTSVT